MLFVTLKSFIVYNAGKCWPRHGILFPGTETHPWQSGPFPVQLLSTFATLGIGKLRAGGW